MLRGPLRTWIPARDGWVEILGRRSGCVVDVVVAVRFVGVVVGVGVEKGERGPMEGRRGGRVRSVLWGWGWLGLVWMRRGKGRGCEEGTVVVRR